MKNKVPPEFGYCRDCRFWTSGCRNPFCEKITVTQRGSKAWHGAEGEESFYTSSDFGCALFVAKGDGYES